MNFEGISLIGFIAYLIITYIPMPAPMPQVFSVAVAVVCILYLILLVFGKAPLPQLPVFH